MDRLALPPPLTVATALRDTVLRSARVVAGDRGLERPIESVAVLDVADFDAVRPGQLVLVSAYELLDAHLPGVVRKLAARHASGLGVKLDDFWPEMPPQLARAADATELPLLALPSGRFEDLLNPLLSMVLDYQSAVLRSVAGLHRALTDAALREGGLESVARIASDALGLPVTILDEDGGVLASTDDDLTFPDELADGLDELPDGGSVTVGDDVYLVAPISSRTRRYGAICVRGAPAGDRFVRATITEAAVVCGIQLLGHRRVEAIHREFEQELLEDLVAGRLDEREARDRVHGAGWPSSRCYVVLLAARRAGDRSAPRIAMAESDFAAFVRALRGFPAWTRPFRYRGGLGAVIHLGRKDEPRAVAEAVGARLASVRAVPWAHEQLVVAVSRPYRDVTLLPAAMREASLTLAVSSPPRRRDDRITHFDDVGVVRLLAQADSARLAELGRAELAPISGAERRGGQLRETLGVLLANNMRLAETSEEMFFHYNTVRHRVARLRAVVDDKLDTRDGQLALWLAKSALDIAEFDRTERRRVDRWPAPR